jgi:hypothetical protein
MPVSNLKVFRPLPGPEYPGREEFNEEVFRSYLDAFLMDAEEYEFLRPERSLKNPTIVGYVLTEPIVIERSPPVSRQSERPHYNNESSRLDRHIHGLECCT